MQHKERVSYATTVKQDKQARTVMISATLQDEQDWQDEQDFSNKKIMMKIYEEISGDTGQMAYPIHPASSCPSCFVAEKPLCASCLFHVAYWLICLSMVRIASGL